MIRVALFIDTFDVGGAETVVLQIAEDLKNRSGYEPVIIHFGSKLMENYCNTANIQHIVANGYKFYKKMAGLPVFSLLFYRFLIRNRIDVLHSHLYGPIIAAPLSARLAGIPHIGTLHDVYMVEEKPYLIWPLKFAVWLGTKLATVSRHMEKFYVLKGGFSTTQIMTIHNGVELADEPNPSNVKSIKTELSINDFDLIYICVARLARLKRHDILIKSFKALSDINACLLIVGDGPLKNDLVALVNKLNLDKKILFLGERSDVQELLDCADVFCLTSDHEGHSCSILEAMSAGLPVITTNVGGNPELVIDGKNGLVAEKQDVKGISVRLRKLAENKNLREEFGAKSRALIQSDFQLSKTVESYLKLYTNKK